MVVNVKIKGLNKLNRFMIDLPKNLTKEIDGTCGQFVRDVQKSAKLRAPRQTGELAQSIKAKKNSKNEWTIVVDSPYGYFQEEGFRAHWVHGTASSRNKLGSIGNAIKMNPAGFAYVKKNKPFMKPALEHNLSKLSQKLSNSTREAITKSK